MKKRMAELVNFAGDKPKTVDRKPITKAEYEKWNANFEKHSFSTMVWRWAAEEEAT